MTKISPVLKNFEWGLMQATSVQILLMHSGYMSYACPVFLSMLQKNLLPHNGAILFNTPFYFILSLIIYKHLLVTKSSNIACYFRWEQFLQVDWRLNIDEIKYVQNPLYSINQEFFGPIWIHRNNETFYCVLKTNIFHFWHQQCNSDIPAC